MAGRLVEAVERMEEAFAILAAEEPDEDFAMLAAQLGRLHFFKGEMELGLERADFALGIGETLGLPEVISQALNTKGIVALDRARPEEAIALIGHALKVALDHDLPASALRAYNNLAEAVQRRDRLGDALELYERALVLARRVGERFWEQGLLTELTYSLFVAGRWDEALAAAAQITELEATSDVIGLLLSVPAIHASRGELDEARRLLEIFDRYRDSADVQERSTYVAALAIVRDAEGRYDEALAGAVEAVDFRSVLGADSQVAKVGFATAMDAAFALGDLGKVEELLGIVDGLRPGEVSPSLRALASRSRGRLMSARGDGPAAERDFKAAAGLFREIETPYWLAGTLVEHGEWLVSEGRADEAEPLLSEARDIFERLGATVWLERLDKVAIAKTPVS